MRGEEDSLHLASKVFREATKRWGRGKQRYNRFTLRETNLSHLGRRKIIFKHALSRGYVSSLEGRCFGPEGHKKTPNQIDSFFTFCAALF